MTIRQMIKDMQNYYTLRYTSTIQVKMIEQYVLDIGADPGVLFDQIVLAFKGQYGKLPDVAAIREIVDGSPEVKRQFRVYQDEDGKVWSRGRKIGHVDSGQFIPLYINGVPENVRQLDHGTPERFVAFLGDDKQLVKKEAGA